MTRRALTVRAHAKVNLDLRVLGIRPDGFHELRTVFQGIDLHDTVVCSERPGAFALACRTPGVPLDERNLIWRAAAALWSALDRAGAPRDVGIRIEKRIPLEAGLGGGSSDAAAALVALGRLWGGASPSHRGGGRGGDPALMPLLREVGATIGADVPFFLSGGTALGLGRGEEIYPLVDLPPHFVVIVRPPFGVSTAEAYGWYDEDRASGQRDENRELQLLPVPWPTRAAQMINDLEPPVIRRHPELAGFKAQLRELGATAAAMSGSGSAVFGLFRSRAAAQKAVKPLSRSGARALVTRTLSRSEHERRSRPVAVRRSRASGRP